MKALSLAVTLTIGAAGVASADGGHGHGTGFGKGSQFSAPGMGMTRGGPTTGMMDEDHHGMMMQMMMGMNSGMMGSGGMMGAGGMPGMALMDRDMMSMMTGEGMTGGMPDQNFDAMMQSRLQEFDGNSDNVLDIDEFEAWHSANMRERMVDRFQHLDADGDGQITGAEMGVAGMRMGAMGAMGTGTGPSGMGGQATDDDN